MSPETIKVLIDMLPTIFIYVVPGYIFIRIINYRFSYDINKDNHLLLKSIVISYILIIIINLFIIITTTSINYVIARHRLIFSINFDIDTIMGKVIVIVVAIISGYIWCKVLTSELCYNFLGRLGIKKSHNTNIFDDMVDLEKGVWIIVYIPEEKIIYFGAFQRYEERENIENCFLVLSNYNSFGYDGIGIDENQCDPLRWVMINTRDISRIELIYDVDSKKIVKSTEVAKLIQSNKHSIFEIIK